MRVIDLTQLIEVDMPVYPGTEQPKLDCANTVEKDGFRETLITMYSHTGTHMDAPAHMIAGGKTLDSFLADKFVGKAVLVDCRDLFAGEEISVERLKSVKDIRTAEYVLLQTGCDKLWGSTEYWTSYPILSPKAAQYLVSLGIKGVGIDAISFDLVDTVTYSIHMILLGAGLVLVENLKDLDTIDGPIPCFMALPLNYKDADGACVRAVALMD